ncbi:MAG: aminopeptidase [Erysipelotrichaceae bacterium]|nr:aminopeptidase [Erysipelotrichaceae bacterium]
MLETAWKKYSDEKLKEVMEFVQGYKKFLADAKTEREFTENAIIAAKKKGFRPFNKNEKLKAGDKVYFNNRGKNVALFVIGKKPVEEGLNILGAHIDSPRIDIKMNPLYEDNGLVLMDTHYYGGIKKYQWVAIPLSLHGVICKKDGSSVKINIGEKDEDPVLGISDLLIHLAKDQMQKTAASVIDGEDLNALVGSIPSDSDSKETVKENILNILKKEYGIEESDFISAELELVPAGKPRDFGLDRSMVMAYGQDDRACAYTSLMGILDSEVTDKTVSCILVDKEEVGSNGTTGAHSSFFENCVAEILEATDGNSDLKLRHALENSSLISSDVSMAYDPNYPNVFENKNTAFFGKGISFNKFTGSRGKSGANDASAEYVAKIRKVMDDNNVSCQFSELGKVDQGGGGTIAYILANKNMNVIDAGIPVQNMHAPFETASKADIYEAYQAYKAFLKDMD